MTKLTLGIVHRSIIIIMLHWACSISMERKKSSKQRQDAVCHWRCENLSKMLCWTHNIHNSYCTFIILPATNTRILPARRRKAENDHDDRSHYWEDIHEWLWTYVLGCCSSRRRSSSSRISASMLSPSRSLRNRSFFSQSHFPPYRLTLYSHTNKWNHIKYNIHSYCAISSFLQQNTTYDFCAVNWGACCNGKTVESVERNFQICHHHR